MKTANSTFSRFSKYKDKRPFDQRFQIVEYPSKDKTPQENLKAIYRPNKKRISNFLPTSVERTMMFDYEKPQDDKLIDAFDSEVKEGYKPSFNSIYNDSRSGIASRWNSICQKYNIKTDSNIESIVFNLNLNEIRDLHNMMNLVISQYVNYSLYHLRSAMDENNILCNNELIFRQIESIKRSMRIIGATCVMGGSIDLSDKEKPIIDNILKPNLDKFIVSFCKSEASQDLIPQRIRELSAKIFNSNNVKAKLLARQYFGEYFSHKVSQNLKNFPANRISYKDFLGIKTNNTHALMKVIQVSLLA